MILDQVCKVSTQARESTHLIQEVHLRRVRLGLLAGLFVSQPPVDGLVGAQVPPLDNLDHLEPLVVGEKRHLKVERDLHWDSVHCQEFADRESEEDVRQDVPKHICPDSGLAAERIIQFRDCEEKPIVASTHYRSSPGM